MKKILWMLLLGLFFVNISTAQYKIPDKPRKQTSVYDYVNLLSESQRQNLESKLVNYSDSTSTQIVLVIIESTKGENIAYLGAQWLTKWGIGQEGKDNGVLITLAKKDRKVNINTGYGVEHLLTDFKSRQIIESRIIPEFKKGNYFKGLDRGTDGIFEVLIGEFKETQKKKRNKNKDDSGFPKFIIFIIFFILLLIFKGRGGGRGRRKSTAGSLLDVIILSNMGRSSGGSFGGFGGGSSSSGGFGGGFGGGMGGGGGATGSW